MDRVKALRESLEDIFADADRILKKATAEDREVTAEEQRRFDGLMAEFDRQAEELGGLESAESQKKQLASLKRASSVVSRSVFDDAFSRTNQERVAMKVNLKHTDLRAFANNAEGRQDAFDCGQWLKALYARSRGFADERAENHAVAAFGSAILATATVDPGQSGGYTVPAPLSSAYISFQKEIGATRRICDYRPMTADTLSIPKLVAGPAVRYVGEAASISTSDQQWGQLTATASKRAILSKVSRELADDNIIGLMDQIVQRFAYEIALVMDGEAILGDGTSTYGLELGLLQSIGSAGVVFAGGSSTSTKDTWTEIVMEDFTNTMAALPSEYASNPRWLCSRAFYHGVMLKLSAAAGGSSLVDLIDGAGRSRPAFLGYEVVMTDKMPTSTGTSQKSALFGTFSDALILAERTPLEIAMSSDRYFDEDLLAIRGVTRYDLLCHTAGDANAAGGYVALSTSAS